MSRLLDKGYSRISYKIPVSQRHPGRSRSRTAVFALAMAVAAAACSTPSQEIDAQPINPSRFASLSCEDLRRELAAAQAEATRLATELDQGRDPGVRTPSLSITILLPRFLMGDGLTDMQADYAWAKGQSQALQQAHDRKPCVAAPAKRSSAP